MPEGHTIHRLARDIGRDLRGQRLVAETEQESFFGDGARRIDGRVLAGTSAMGKHLFLHLDGAEVLHVHLGLFGKFRRHAVPAPQPSPNLRLRLSGDTAAWDLTGPTVCALRPPEVLDEVAAKLGPDPLLRDADPDHFVQRVLRSSKPIGALLLDQSVIAGIGNVYRAELLHLAGIHPDRPGRSLSEAEVKGLWHAAVEQLRLGLQRNRIVTVPLAGRRLARVPREESWHVYQQDRCRRCGGPVEVHEVGNRRSFACPRCQTR